jgi:hypothetical protein
MSQKYKNNLKKCNKLQKISNTTLFVGIFCTLSSLPASKDSGKFRNIFKSFITFA